MNVTGLSTRPAANSRCVLSGAADAKMSAGAPFLICVSSTFEPAKLYFWRLVEGLEDLGQRRRGVDGEGIGLRLRTGGRCESQRDDQRRSGERGCGASCGRLLAKVGLDCVARGLDVDGRRERDPDHAPSGEAGERRDLLRDVRRHRREERPVRRDRDTDRGARGRRPGAAARSRGRSRPAARRVANVPSGHANSKSSATAAVCPASVSSFASAAACSVALSAPCARSRARGAGDDLRCRRPRVEVREQELGCLAEARRTRARRPSRSRRRSHAALRGRSRRARHRRRRGGGCDDSWVRLAPVEDN